MQNDIGIIGMGVMGENIAFNIADKGFSVAIFNRNGKKTEDIINGEGRGKLIGTFTLEELVKNIKIPRKILLMIPAGDAIDQMIEQIAPFLDKEDIIIDGGNSFFKDTGRRVDELNIEGINFVGMGISGGKTGARKGPSLMAGGNANAQNEIETIFKKISAKDPSGSPCYTWTGKSGSGHFIKMVHNGIEYALMQNIAEIHLILRTCLGMAPDEISSIFTQWNTGKLQSFLLEISSKILQKKDSNGEFIINSISDRTSHKGTGKHTAETFTEFDLPSLSIHSALASRLISNNQPLREEIHKKLNFQTVSPTTEFSVEAIQGSLLLSNIVAFEEGFSLIDKVSNIKGWNINKSEIARIWQNGCIIRNGLLEKIKETYSESPLLPNLLLSPYFTTVIKNNITHLKDTIRLAMTYNLPTQGLTSSLNYILQMSTTKLPTNLIAAQRDYFGNHGLYSTDDTEKSIHLDWN